MESNDTAIFTYELKYPNVRNAFDLRGYEQAITSAVRAIDYDADIEVLEHEFSFSSDVFVPRKHASAMGRTIARKTALGEYVKTYGASNQLFVAKKVK